MIGIKILGVPNGVRWINIWLKKFTHPYNIIPNHRLIDIDKQKFKCLDDVKIYGTNPHILLEIINVKIPMNIIEFDLEYDIRGFNSFIKILIIFIIRICGRDGMNQYIGGININKIIILNQFIDI